MSLTVSSKGGGNFEPIPQGLHRGICQAVYDLGEQQTNFGPKNKVLVSFELPDIRIDIEENGITRNVPRIISQQFTASLNEKANLRKVLEGWRGRQFTAEELDGFDLSKIVGKPCQIQVMHERAKDDPSKVYGNLKNVLPYTSKEQLTSELGLVVYEIGQPVPAGTPEWIEKIIMKSAEMGGNADQPAPQHHGRGGYRPEPDSRQTRQPFDGGPDMQDPYGYQMGPTGYEEPNF